MSVDRLRRIAGIAIVLAATGCLETYAPPERGPVVPPVYGEVTIDPAGGISPAVLLEGETGIHVLYITELLPDWGGPYPLAYAGCPGGCELGSHWQAGRVDSIYSSRTPAAVLSNGSIHLAYPALSGGREVLRFSTCTAGCTSASNWQRTDLDTVAAVDAALAADSSGTLHLVYARHDSMSASLRYGSCAASCTSSGDWSWTTIATGFTGSSLSLGLDANHGIHFAYIQGRGSQLAGRHSTWISARLRYGECRSACGNAGSWTLVALDSGRLSSPSLAIEGGTRVDIAYGDGSETRIITCSAACVSAPDWSREVLQGYGGGPKLAVGPTGTQHLVWMSGEGLAYARCSDACETASGWERSIIQPYAWGTPGIAVDSQDHPRVAYTRDLVLGMAVFR